MTSARGGADRRRQVTAAKSCDVWRGAESHRRQSSAKGWPRWEKLTGRVAESAVRVRSGDEGGRGWGFSLLYWRVGEGFLRQNNALRRQRFINTTRVWLMLPRLEGNPNFLHRLSLSFFFLRSTYTLECTMFKFGTFPGSFTIFGSLFAFSRHLCT